MKKYKKNLIATIILCIVIGVYYIIREITNINMIFRIMANVTIFMFNITIILGTWIPAKKVEKLISYSPKGNDKATKVKHCKEVIEALSFNLTKGKKIFIVIITILMMGTLGIAQLYGYYNNDVFEIVMNIESFVALCAVLFQMHSAYSVVRPMDE